MARLEYADHLMGQLLAPEHHWCRYCEEEGK
jgi:hypothetical protein